MKTGIGYLLQRQQDGGRVAVYCAGLHGALFSEILKQAGIAIDAFFDGDSGKWGREIAGGVRCLNPHAISDKGAYEILICIAPAHYRETEQCVRNMGFKNIVSLNDVFDDIILTNPSLYLDLIRQSQSMPPSEMFYTPGANGNAFCGSSAKLGASERIAAYTCIFGDYDALCLPQVFPENVDYYLVSDRRPENIGLFKWVDAKAVVPPGIETPVKRNRYIKMHPHLLFPEYRYSIYLDGNVAVEQDISAFIKSSKSGIAAFMHAERDCIFYEAITVVNFRRAVADGVCGQMQRYLEEGMPLHYGLAEMPVIAREHHKPACVKVMEDWWKEFDAGAQRDQLSFMYAMWKNGMALADMASLGSDVHKDERISMRPHFRDGRVPADEKRNAER